MDDPTVAGSVAIILQGIQITKPLDEYYEAHKGLKSYIADTATKLTKLHDVVESLQSQLTGHKFGADEESLLGEIEASI